MGKALRGPSFRPNMRLSHMIHQGWGSRRYSEEEISAIAAQVEGRSDGEGSSRGDGRQDASDAATSSESENPALAPA